MDEDARRPGNCNVVLSSFDKELVSTQVGLRQDGRKPLFPRESNTGFPLRSLVTFKGKVSPWPTMKEYAGVYVQVYIN